MAQDIATVALALDSRQIERGRQALATLRAEAPRVEAATARVQSAWARMQATTAALNAGITRVQSALFSVRGALAAFGAIRFGQTLVRDAIDLDTTLTQLNTLMGISRQQTEAWRDELIKMGPEVVQTPQQLAAALKTIVGSGIEADRAMEVLAASARASTIGLGDTETIVRAVTAAMNAYAESGLTAEQAVSVLLRAIDKATFEAPEFAGAIGQVITVASQLGVSLDEASGAMAAMSLTGSDASEAAVQLRGIFTAILKPGEQAQKVLAQYGLTADKLRKVLDEDGLLAFLKLLSETVGTNEEAIATLVPNVRGLVGLFSLVGENAAQAEAIMRSVSRTVGTEVKDAFDASADSMSRRYNQALIDLDQQMNMLGQKTVPAFVALLVTLNENLETTVRLSAILIGMWVGARGGIWGLMIGGAAGFALGETLIRQMKDVEEATNRAVKARNSLVSADLSIPGFHQTSSHAKNVFAPAKPDALDRPGGGLITEDLQEDIDRVRERIELARLNNEVLLAEVSGNSDLVRQKEIELAVRREISDEVRAAAPEAAAAMEQQIRLESDLTHAIETRLKVIQDVTLAVTSNMDRAFSDFVENGKAGFTDLVNSILKDLARIAFQQAVTKPLGDALTSVLGGLFGGGSGGVLGGLFGGGGTQFAMSAADVMAVPESMWVPVGHRGGIGRNLTEHRRVDPESFFGAPRFHAGRLPWGRNEMPAIIRPDEGIFTPEQMRALGGGVNVIIVNKTSTPVQGEAKPTPGGRPGRDITIELAEIVAKDIRRTGAPANMAVQSLGGRTPLVRG